MLSFYNKYILPRLLDRDMRPVEFNATRSKTVSLAHGIVLEVGFGPGYNLPFYNSVEKLYALEPSQELYNYAKGRVDRVPFPVEYLQCSAENIPIESSTIDAVVSTWTLCSISNLPRALREVNRVLKPGGRFLFAEHGKSPKKFNFLFQRLITQVSKYFTGNCHLDRDIHAAITESGLEIQSIEIFQEDGRPLMFSYHGTATKNI